MQNKQLQQIALTQRGEGAELISASQLSPGMYLYALIADGTRHSEKVVKQI